mgnify:CR=1 FL=1
MSVCRGAVGGVLADFFEQVVFEIGDGDPFLLHRVAMAESDSAFLLWAIFSDGVEIDGDAERRSCFVLASVAATDGTGLIVENIHDATQRSHDLTGFFHELGFVFEKREDAAFDRGHAGVEAHHGAGLGFSLFVGDGFLVEGLANEGQRGAIGASTRFDDMWNEAFFRHFIIVIEGLSAVLDVFAEIVIRAVGNAFEFAHAEGEFVFQIVGFFGVKGAFAIGDIVNVNLRAGDTDVLVEREALLEPVVGELHAILGAAEILDFHLLELPGPEDVVAGVDLVAKGFSDLRDAEGQLLASRIEHIAEIHKNRLSCLGA